MVAFVAASPVRSLLYRVGVARRWPETALKGLVRFFGGFCRPGVPTSMLIYRN